MKKASLLLVDDDRHLLDSMASWLRDQGYSVSTASSLKDAKSALDEQTYDLALVDIRLGPDDGFAVLHYCREKRPETTVILMTGYGYDPTHALVKARQDGLRFVLFKPFRVDQLRDALANDKVTR